MMKVIRAWISVPSPGLLLGLGLVLACSAADPPDTAESVLSEDHRTRTEVLQAVDVENTSLRAKWVVGPATDKQYYQGQEAEMHEKLPDVSFLRYRTERK